MTRKQINRRCATAMTGLGGLLRHAKAMDGVPGGQELQELAADTMKKINKVIEEHGK